MTTRCVLILGMLMTGHVMAQTKPAAPTLDTLMRTDLDVPVSDALTEMDLDAPATTDVAAAKANVAPAMLYESKDPELVAADIGRLVILHSTGSGGADSTRATGWPTVSRCRVRTGRNRRCTTNC